MRFTTLTLLFTAAAGVYSSAIPRSASQVAAQIEDRLQLAFLEVSAMASDDEDECPRLLVECVRETDGEKKVVGDIGEKDFEKKGNTVLSCRQKHRKVNVAECNAKYPIACATQCTAEGSPL